MPRPVLQGWRGPRSTPGPVRSKTPVPTWPVISCPTHPQPRQVEQQFSLRETEKLFDQIVQWSEQREVVPQEVSLLAKNDFFHGKQGAF